MDENQAVEISRHDSANGYVYEYDESLAAREEIRRADQPPDDAWRASADTEADAKVDAKAA
jgi:hypothetical protein